MAWKPPGVSGPPLGDSWGILGRPGALLDRDPLVECATGGGYPPGGAFPGGVSPGCIYLPVGVGEAPMDGRMEVVGGDAIPRREVVALEYHAAGAFEAAREGLIDLLALGGR